MKLKKLTPNFEVKNVGETTKFYLDVLGFNLIMAVPEKEQIVEKSINDEKDYIFAIVVNGDVEIMLQRVDKFIKDMEFARDLPLSASVSFYMEIEGLDVFHSEIKNKVSEITEPKIAWYGMKEFYTKDPNGYILGFAERIEK